VSLADPSGRKTRVVEVESPATATVTDELRLHDRLAHRLPAHVAAAIEEFDPDRRGVSLAGPFELNTRMSAGASTVADVDRRFFTFLQANLVAGVDTGLTVDDLESLVPLTDATRTGKA
jgi:uncharacterized protein (UPF0262 family)